ncbi:Ger(x)C family spore germination protein [Paenibacillus foliorum]|uniref:Ger(x)C family spore germination protein n=1 Tax=Paenibacillus foliorum TaxID=2654974 RepID=UPI0014931FCA|nr:Ger(x)C family spore germination protein [Paenibacillus foliorum]
MKLWPKLALICAVLVSLAGCWDSKPIQNMAYVTAIGLDYKDNQIILYAQVLNFLNVAKSEHFEIGKNVPVWIGRGTGKTISEAMTSIYETSQLRVYWGHVKAIVCSEEILKEKETLRQAYDGINRYREIRYNVLLYGTKMPLTEILSQKSIFHFSPLDTILDTPEDIFSQRSFVPPQYGYKIISEINELGRTPMLPSITITKKVWTEDQTTAPMFLIDGAFLINKNTRTQWFSEDDLKGVRWIQKKMKRSLINIPDSKKPLASLILYKPRHSIQYYFENNELRFKVIIKVSSYIDETMSDISIKAMEKLAETVVRDEVISTYEKGLETQTDTLNLLGELYRNAPRKWRELQQEEGKLELKKSTLGKVEVHVNIMHTGKYKGRSN